LPPEGGPPRIAIQVKKTLSTYDELAGVLKAASWYISAFNEHNAETGFYRVEIWRADWKIPPTFCEEAAV
jgi:hypothetical protein